MLMDMNRPRLLIGVLLVFTLLLLTGCRARTGGTSSLSSAVTHGAGGSASGSETGWPDERIPEEEFDETGERTQENPEASRKEYDEDAPAEIAAGEDRYVHAWGTGDGKPVTEPDASERVSRLDGDAEETATETVPADEAEILGVSEDAEEADSAMKYYSVLLQDRLASLFECKRVYVYWETSSDRVTIHRSSPEHTLIMNAGAYDVSARLLEENLRVDDGWVVRKDPGVIVKAAGSDILGTGAMDTSRAETLLRQMVTREGWDRTGAVKERRVLILSEELLETPYLTVAAELILAKCAYPELFADIDPEEAIALLCGEAGVSAPEGIFCLMMEER